MDRNHPDHDNQCESPDGPGDREGRRRTRLPDLCRRRRTRRRLARGEQGWRDAKLDDPGFEKPLRAAFFEKEEDGSGVLVWNRQKLH